MKVRLIDYTGKGQADPADYAAKLLIFAKSTRLTQSEDTQAQIGLLPPSEVQEQLTAISNTIRSSHEFVDYTWEITGVTRAFTHQFVRSRHLSFAQQAQRVANMERFETLLPSSVKNANLTKDWGALMEDIAAFYKRMRAAGVPAQDARGVLPTNVLTNIIAKANLRAFSDLVGKRLNARAQDEYSSVVELMAKEVMRVHPWTKQFLFPDRSSTPALNMILKEVLGNRSPVDAPAVNDALKELDKLKAVW